MYAMISVFISEVLLVIDYLFSESTVSVNTNGSTILGSKLYTTFDHNPYVAFWKIPYAKPPVGSDRYKPPRPINWLSLTRNEYNQCYNATCTTELNEDCLYLSIYMPYRKHKDTFAVMVWLHEESNCHGPDFLIDENIIVVTVSYRTSILGFLNTGDEFAQGNMGAKDVIEALKWIRDNTIYFNGDPNRVTVIGSGAAANLVASFLISPLAEDLFSRAIVQSGSALSPADYRSYNFEILNKLYWNLFGAFEKLNRTRLYKRLADAPARELISVSRDLFDSSEVRDAQRLINVFGPSVDSGKHSFMDEDPLCKYKTRSINNDVAVMMGFTNLESMHKLSGFVNNKKLLKYLNFNFQYLLPFGGRKDEYGSRQYDEIRRKIMDFYFVNGTIGERSLRRYAKYLSDQVIYPVLHQARLHSSRSRNRVYLYRFSFQGCLNVAWRSSLSDLRMRGATQGDEICYQFRCKSVDDLYDAAVPAERHFVTRMARLLGNFAKYGDPTPEGDDILGDLKWSPFDYNNRFRGMNLGHKMGMIEFPEGKRVQFWDQLKIEKFADDSVT